MKEFPGKPQYSDAELEKLKRIFRKDRRPTSEELENFVVTPEYWNKAMELYRKDRQWMIDAAAKSRDKAYQYRGFKVGASAMGIEPGLPPDEPVLYYSGNFKYSLGEVKGEDKRCAERNVLDAAKGRVKVIVALVTVSKEVHTGDPTKARDVLHPCRDCRDMFRKYLEEGFMRENTIMCGVNDAEGELKIEERTLKDLLDLYSDDT